MAKKNAKRAGGRGQRLTSEKVVYAFSHLFKLLSILLSSETTESFPSLLPRLVSFSLHLWHCHLAIKVWVIVRAFWESFLLSSPLSLDKIETSFRSSPSSPFSHFSRLVLYSAGARFRFSFFFCINKWLSTFLACAVLFFPPYLLGNSSEWVSKWPINCDTVISLHFQTNLFLL